MRVIANEISEREGLSVIFNPATERVARKMRGDETTPKRRPDDTCTQTPNNVERDFRTGTAATAAKRRDRLPLNKRGGRWSLG